MQPYFRKNQAKDFKRYKNKSGLFLKKEREHGNNNLCIFQTQTKHTGERRSIQYKKRQIQI